MKLKFRLCAILLSLVLVVLLVLGICRHISAANGMAEGQLQIPEGSSMVELSANENYISAIYINDNIYHAAVFTAEGTLVYEPCQSENVLSADFLNSGALAVRRPDVLEVWDVQEKAKVCTYDMEEGALQDADGQAVWHTETIEKNNEIGVPATYITKAIRTSADGMQQSVLEMPDGTAKLLYAEYPYLYYEKEIADYRKIVCRININTREDTELADWIRGKDTPMGHASKLFQSEILMPWELSGQMFVTHHAQIIAQDGTTLLLQGDDIVCAVDAENKTLLLQIPCDDAVVAGAVMEEKQCVVLADASSATVYHWQEEATPTNLAEMVDLADLSDAIAVQRADLLSHHGITVTNDETMVEEFFQPQALTSELRSYVAGIELTNFFTLLPQGLTDEMRPAALEIFPVCLTGHMTCVGLSVPYEEDYYLALDVNFLYDSVIYDAPIPNDVSPFMDTLPHEFMHMLEYHLTQTTLPDGEPILSLWDAFVPPEEDDESFSGTYEGDWDASNSLESGDPTEEVWFEGAYSRTMPQEDRATLFACLVSGVHSNGEGWDVYPHLLEKGQLLCAIIREGYPAIKATPEGSMYWERNFEQRPLSSFSPQ